MSKTIVVTGVTGIQGGSVAETFLSTPGWKVRGITRNPDGEAARAQAAKGVEIVSGDLDDTDTLVAAFEGAHAIFANTDFFAPLFTAIQSPAIAAGADPCIYAHDVEFNQGMNIAAAAAVPSTLKTLERLIWSSLTNITKASEGKYTSAYHMDVKSKVEDAIRDGYPALASILSSVQVGHYVTNWYNFPPARPQKQPDGSFIIERSFSPTLKFPFIYAQKDTGPFVKALVIELAPGTTLLAAAEELTWPEFTATWARILGVTATYKQVSHDEHFAGVPEPLKNELVETFKYVDEFGFTGDDEVKTANQLGVKVPVTTMAEYIKQEDWSSVL